ncbi:MAG: hypothetical protein Q9174_006990, partial [Haloplaca sp. 1 TL-2023]
MSSAVASIRLSLVAALTVLSQERLTYALRDATSTPTGLTQVGIATDCNNFTYADPEDTCNEVVARFGLTLSRFTSWNTVLGSPDGKYCQTQFWAGYDYCVGVDRTASPDAGTAAPSNNQSIASPDEMVAGKQYIRLPNDMPSGEYTVEEGDCISASAEYYSKCWQKLNMSSWLPEWYAQEPQCKDPLQVRGCRKKLKNTDTFEAWTTTLNREYIGTGGTECTGLPGDCQGNYGPRVGEGIPDALAPARYRYLHFNIAAIHKFFGDWQSTVTTALSIADGLITAIVNFIDQRKAKKTNVLLNVILSVLGAGLFLIPVIGPIAGVSALSIGAANVGLTAIKSSPPIAQALFPRGTGDAPQKSEIDILSVQTATLQEDLRVNIQTTLRLVQGVNQTDTNAFLAFAGNGDFSSNLQNVGSPDVNGLLQPDRISPLLSAYTTFITSTTLAQSGWHAILVPGADPRGISNGSTQYPAWATHGRNEDDLQCSDYNEFGQ